MNIKRFLKDKISDCIFALRKPLTANLLKRACRILIYHAIESPDLRNDALDLLVSPEVFNMHMRHLKENGFRVISLTDLTANLVSRTPIEEKSVVITFDDGYKGILTDALPAVKKFGFTATLFINIYFIERKLPAGLYYSNWRTLTWEEIVALKKENFSIGAHGLSHRKLTLLNEKELKDEIIESKRLIENNINDKIKLFSYPHGAFNNMAKKSLKESGFISACSSIEGSNGIDADIFALRRTEITAFDDTPYKFEKKLSGCYDWLGYFKEHD